MELQHKKTVYIDVSKIDLESFIKVKLGLNYLIKKDDGDFVIRISVFSSNLTTAVKKHIEKMIRLGDIDFIGIEELMNYMSYMSYVDDGTYFITL